MATILIGGSLANGDCFAVDLRAAGYEVNELRTSGEVLEATRRCPPEVLILCDGLSDPGSFGVCTAVRQEQALPIIMVSSQGDELDRVVGLELGADHYVDQPVSGREIVARVRSLLRRIRLVEEKLAAARGELLRAGDLVVDLRQHVVTVAGQAIQLKPREFGLLAYLVENQGTAHTREELIEAVWDGSHPEGLRTVDIHVRGLREKIEADPANPDRLRTVRGVGYRLVATSRGRQIAS